MKHFLIFFLLFASSAAAQGVRFSATVTQQTTVNGVNTVTLPANPQVAFCAHPANAVPCTNKATTYTDQTLATPCSTSTQIVRDGTTTCVASPDAQNNFGFWFAPNTNGYDWTVTLPGGVNLGPFNVLSQTTTVSNAATFAQINKTCYVDGTTNTTISQALTCAGSGGSIVVPSGYSATLGSTTFVNNPVSIIIDGAQITNTSGGALLQLQASNITVLCKNNAQITLSGSGSFAFGLGDGAGSTFSNQRIEGCRINGAGTLGLAQGGFSAASALLINLQIINNTITNVNYGTVLNETTAGQGLVGPKIIGNYIKNVVGSLPGAGYGINAASFVLATGTMQYVGGIIANNYVENAGRHSIYLGFGSGWTVTGNYLKGNACISTPNGSLSVAPIGRSRGTVWSGNVIDGACDIGLQITGDNTYTNDSLISSDVTVSGNTFLNNQAQDIVIGNGAPAANGTVDHITVTGNTIYKTGFNVRGIEIVSGKQILVEGNTITLLAAGGNTSGIIFDGGGESGATNTFNDDVSIRGNLIHTAGGGTAGIQWTSAAAGSTARYDISSNRINSDTAMFCGGGAGCSDPNVTILDTPTVISGTQGFTTAILKPVIIASPILTPSALPALSGTTAYPKMLPVP